MKRLCRSAVMAVIATLLIAMPVWAMYYAYIYIEETAGNSYSDLPLMVSANVSQLVAGQYITSTGLDTRVLTGDGYPLPHMLANDRILFVSDLEAYEDKTLIFYTGASSLSSFPIIVGHGGNITTPDDPSIEPAYIFQLLASGYFDASAAADKNIMYKEDAFRVYISGANTLAVAGLSAGDVEEWTMEDTGFTSGDHAIYVMANGIGAYLYVDNMSIPVDTVNLFDSDVVVFDASYDARFMPFARKTFYANGRYWAFYAIGGGTWYGAIYCRTSTDGASWTGASSIGIDGGTDFQGFSVWFDGTYFHVAYGDKGEYADDNGLRYRSGTPNADGSITWRAAWQNVYVDNGDITYAVIATDASGYPYIRYNRQTGTYSHQYEIIKSSLNNGTWSTAGGYPTTGIVYERGVLVGYPNSNKMYVISSWQTPSQRLMGTYYNGTSWSGSQEVIDADYTSCMTDQFNAIADEDDNLVIVWRDGTWATCGVINLKVRYADGSFSSTIEAVSTGGASPTVSYDTVNDVFYIFYTKSGSIYARALDLNVGTISAEYLVGTPTSLNYITATPYGNHIGVLSVGSATTTSHTSFDFPWEWEDNNNDIYWIQNNVMPYADYLMMGIDGTWQLEYQPATIIQGTTLPDVSTEGDHDGTITWGSNPDGVDVSISGLLTDETEDQYDYAPYIDLGGQDIIQPEPATLTGDIDMTKLARNPFRPLALAIAGAGGFSERLVWLGMGWIALIIAMLIVHLGLESRPGEQPEHFILTAVTGLGLSILFYVTGSFPLWPVILLSFGFITSIVYERMPHL